MKSVLKLLGSVLVFAAAVLALPAFAGAPPNGSKTFSLEMSVPGPGQVQAVIKNTSPGASTAAINSVDLFFDLGWTVASVKAFESNAPSVFLTVKKNQPPGHFKITSMAPLKPFASSGNTLVFQFTLSGTSSGDGTFNANVYAGSSLNGNQFAQNGGQNIASVPSASLACGGDQSSSIAPGTIIASRGGWNKDGTISGDPCAAVNYYASDTLGNNAGLPPIIVHFRWDQSGTDQTFSTAAFDYKIFYASPAPSTIHVGWLYQDGTPAVDPGANPNASSVHGPVVFIDAPSCLTAANVVPKPYGSLTQTMAAGDDVLYIDTTGAPLSPPPAPPVTDPPTPFPQFSIYVGLERMLVTGYNDDGSWNVLRGQLGTTPVEHDVVDDVGPLVMSTPLPSLGNTAPAAYLLLANGTFASAGTNPYLANTQAQICLSATGTSGGFPFIELIDIGDGWGLGR